MKKLILLLLAITFIASINTSCIKTKTIYQDNETFVELKVNDSTRVCFRLLDESTAEVVSPAWFHYGMKYAGQIDIPESFEYKGNTYRVVAIGKQAFSWAEDPLKVNIPYGVERIEEEAFCWTKRLKSLEIPNSVTEIGRRAFASSSIKNIKLSNTLNELPVEMFTNSQLTYVEIPESVSIISTSAFEGCYHLVEVELPSQLTELQNNAFKDCGELRSINIPNSLILLGSNAFSNCENLRDFHFPDNTQVIKPGVLKGCSSIKEIVIPNTVLGIEDHAFDNTGIESCVIPESVMYLGHGVFNECQQLKTVTVQCTEPPFGPNDHYVYVLFENCDALEAIFVPAESAELYRNEENWRQYRSMIFPIP